MTNHDLTDFTKQMAGLCVVYNRPNSTQLTEIYFKCLREYELITVSTAIEKYIKTATHSEFFPKPGDIIKMIVGENEHRAIQAFAKAHTCNVSSYDTVVFDDPLIHAVIRDLGGWKQFCMRTEDEIPFLEKRFAKLYEGYLNLPPTTYPEKLIGLHDTPPILIGDQTKAMKLLNRVSALEHISEK